MSATEEQWAQALVAALNAAEALAVEYDDLPATRPNAYTELALVRMYAGEARGDGYKGTESYRVTTRQVAKTVTNARLLRSRTHTALEYVSVTANGVTSTPLMFEGAEVIGPDDGWYSGLETWTFTA